MGGWRTIGWSLVAMVGVAVLGAAVLVALVIGDEATDRTGETAARQLERASPDWTGIDRYGRDRPPGDTAPVR